MTQLPRQQACQTALLLRNAERILARLPADDRVATVLGEIRAALAIIDRTWDAAHA